MCGLTCKASRNINIVAMASLLARLTRRLGLLAAAAAGLLLKLLPHQINAIAMLMHVCSMAVPSTCKEMCSPLLIYIYIYICIYIYISGCPTSNFACTTHRCILPPMIYVYIKLTHTCISV